ncbi:tyrosine-type recombinase/integrase [Pseudomonas umsongensis]|uniref:Tyrosine-type recombinase/integrase n=1 Tax=Pseudomonas umsongensis TaxID=198618 RepID=A0AAE7A026_9PSED|nr:tyrosine-type recombinase/integrase [Pseudomonas umsongensis]
MYIEDALFKRVYEKADAGLRHAMDFSYLTGQRVTDTRLLDERDVREGQIWVLQGKTNAKRRIEITGELRVLIDRIMSRKSEHKVRSTRLIVSEDGTPMSVAMLQGRFDLAREAAGVEKSEFQMRDLRAKASTDKAKSSGDILQARDQLGHTTVVMTSLANQVNCGPIQ